MIDASEAGARYAQIDAQWDNLNGALAAFYEWEHDECSDRDVTDRDKSAFVKAYGRAYPQWTAYFAELEAERRSA